MESTEKPLRVVWPLLKARVSSYEGGKCKLEIGGSTTITVDVQHPQVYDIRVGDLLTLYTEVLLAKPTGTS
jgi:hypothetical protein